MKLGVIRGVGVGAARVASYKPPSQISRTPRPRKPRRPRNVIPPAPAPTTHTATITGTGNTTVSGGDMPGVPPPSDGSGLPPWYQMPQVKNWNKATPKQIAMSMLAPQYAAIYGQQHQDELMAHQQQAAITSYGADLAKILGGAGPGGVKGTLGPDYAAALSMAAMRNFAYQRFLSSQRYADAYAKVAASYPTLLNQARADAWERKYKEDALRFQKLMGAKQFGLDVAKLGFYQSKAADQSKQAWARIGVSKLNAKIAMKRYGLSAQQYQLAVQRENRMADQYNQTRADKQNQINVSASRAAGRWITYGGKDITAQVPYKPPYKTSSSSSSGGKDNRFGLTSTGYQKQYGTAYRNAGNAVKHGIRKDQYIDRLLGAGIKKGVAERAWRDWHKRNDYGPPAP